MTDEEILSRIEIISTGEIDEPEVSEWLNQIERQLFLPDGHLCDLIFWPSRYGLGDNPTPSAILAQARLYRPILL